MPAQHLVPAFTHTLRLSPRTQANALKALALVPDEPTQDDWAPRAAAAILIGASWAGETVTESEVAEAVRIPEQQVAQHYAWMAERLRKHAP